MTDPDLLRELRARVRFRPFEASLVRLERSESRPTRPGRVVLQPFDEPALEALADVPQRAGLDVVGADVLEAALAAALALRWDELGAPIFRVRQVRRVGNAELAGRVPVEILAPHETTIALPDQQRLRHLGYVDPRRRHAKTFKHVLRLGGEVGGRRPVRLPLTLLADARVEPLDWSELSRLDCKLVERAEELTGDDDFFQQVCRGCFDATVHAVDRRVRPASQVLERVAREVVEEAEVTVARFPQGYRGGAAGFGFAGRRGALHLTRSAGRPGSEVEVATTTYLVARRGDSRPSREAAEERLRASVRGAPGAAFLRERGA